MAKKVERYFYPAVFTYEEEQEIAVVFPDLDVATSGENDDDALLSARELHWNPTSGWCWWMCICPLSGWRRIISLSTEP